MIYKWFLTPRCGKYLVPHRWIRSGFDGRDEERGEENDVNAVGGVPLDLSVRGWRCEKMKSG